VTADVACFLRHKTSEGAQNGTLLYLQSDTFGVVGLGEITQPLTRHLIAAQQFIRGHITVGFNGLGVQVIKTALE
jgi:hypothetical protein